MSASQDSPTFPEGPWLKSLDGLAGAFPAIRTFLERLRKENAISKKLVLNAYEQQFGHPPGRCALLSFLGTGVEELNFRSPEDLASFFDRSSRTSDSEPQHRLWILEDLAPAWMEVLGSRLDIPPQVFGEQTNTFNFTDSETIQARFVPSLSNPSSWFTLRYFEVRQLQDHNAITTDTNQVTFDFNARRIERWRDIDSPTFHQKWRHIFIRRCASFWTNQIDGSEDWDAVLLVDAPYDAFPWSEKPSQAQPRACNILQDSKAAADLKTLWAARKGGPLCRFMDTTKPYHGGSTTFTSRPFDTSAVRLDPDLSSPNRNLTSLLDETVLHWTKLAPASLINTVHAKSVNSAYFLLKSLSNAWVNHLDLIQTTIAQSEFVYLDYQARVDTQTSHGQWARTLTAVANTTLDINYLRRQLHHFEAHMSLNLERLGVIAGANALHPARSRTIRDAQQDFIHLQARLQPMLTRAADLSRSVTDITNLNATFKGVKDAETGVALSLIAIVVFPATLIASMFSMGSDFLPGNDQFWIFWATTVPVCIVLAAVLLYGADVRAWLNRKMSWRRLYRKDGPHVKKE